MGGPNLEVFKMGFYLFFPIAVMAHFADQSWYDEHVAPYRAAFWPDDSTLNHPPSTSAGARAELSRMKAERTARRAEQTGELSSTLSALARDEDGRIDLKAATPRELRSRGDIQGGVVGGFRPGEKWV